MAAIIITDKTTITHTTITTTTQQRTELPYASLYYREGSSDKEYHVRIEAQADGYVVNYAYGKRGAASGKG